MAVDLMEVEGCEGCDGDGDGDFDDGMGNSQTRGRADEGNGAKGRLLRVGGGGGAGGDDGGYHGGGYDVRDVVVAEVLVPRGVVGRIIGSGGANVKALEAATGAQVRFLVTSVCIVADVVVF
jgi:hypothetical protein